MLSSRRAAQDAEWLQRKAAIQRMILQENKSLLETRQKLNEDGFSVTKAQLEYKLKIWDFRKRLPKNRSEAVWQYIDIRLMERETQGKSSEVIIEGKVIKDTAVRKERNRHQRSTLAKYSRAATSPKAPEGIKVSICTPPSMPMRFSWPASLPWLKFQARMTEVLLPRMMRMINSQPHQPAKNLDLGFLDSVDLSNASSTKKVDLLAAQLGSMMPEAREGENVNRAQVILKGSTNEVSYEYIKFILYRISNNMLSDLAPGYREQVFGRCPVLDILQSSGITRMSLQLGETTDVTIAAIAENLFSYCIGVLMNYRTFDIHSFCNKPMKVIDWLLVSGQSPNIQVQLKMMGDLTTPFKAAIEAEQYDLALRLLDAGAEVMSSPEDRMSILADVLGPFRFSFEQDARAAGVLLLVKRLIDMGASPHKIPGHTGPSALMMALDCHNPLLVAILLQNGADILHHSVSDYPLSIFIQTQSVLGCAAGIRLKQEALDTVQYLLKQAQSLYPSMSPADFITVDVIFAAALQGHSEILTQVYKLGSDIVNAESKGFSALHCAAMNGHADTCMLLLEHGALVDGPECSTRPPSPLMLASLMGHDKVVELLYQHGADLNFGITTSTNFDWQIYFGNNKFHRSNPEFDSIARSICWIDSISAAVINFKNRKSNKESTCHYLLRHGAILPEWTAYYGARTQDLALVNLALANNINPNWRDSEGKTCLQVALSPINSSASQRTWQKNRRADIATALLRAGAGLAGGEVQRAVLLERWSLVEEILQLDSAGDAKQCEATSILEVALRTGSRAIVEAVFARSLEAYTPSVLYAGVLFTITDGKVDILQQILSNRQHSDEPTTLELFALGMAVYRDARGIVDILYTALGTPTVVSIPDSEYQLAFSTEKQLRYDWEKWNGNGMLLTVPAWYWRSTFKDISPLSLALKSTWALEKLLKHGCLPDKYTVVAAVKNGNLKLLERLLKMPRLNFRQMWCEEPLCCAVGRSDISMAKILLEAGEDVNAPSSQHFGRSPLQAAVQNGDLTMIDLLIKAGAQVNAPAAANCGATALQMAAINGHIGIAKTLLDLGADVDAPRAEYKGRTALEGAAEHGRIDMIQFLLSQGAQIGGEGRLQYLRAIRFAREEGHLVAANMLKSHRDWTAADQDMWDKLQKLSDWQKYSEKHFFDFETNADSKDEPELPSGVTEEGFLDEESFDPEDKE